MRDIRYLVNEEGQKTAVVIDLRRLQGFWEDFYDAYLAEQRASEPRESIGEVKTRLIRAGKLALK